MFVLFHKYNVAHSLCLLHLRAREGVGLAVALYQHLPVAEEFAGRGSVGSRGAGCVCAYVGIVLHKADGITISTSITNS